MDIMLNKVVAYIAGVAKCFIFENMYSKFAIDRIANYLFEMNWAIFKDDFMANYCTNEYCDSWYESISDTYKWWQRLSDDANAYISNNT